MLAASPIYRRPLFPPPNEREPEPVRLDRNPEFLRLAAEYEATMAAQPVIARDAEIDPGQSAAWYVVVTGPGQEKTAAGHLAGRRFGVYVPEIEETVIKRCIKRTITTPLFRGYVFTFVWGINRHWGRIAACPGVSDLLRHANGDAPSLPDQIIDQIRTIENAYRPLKMTVESVSMKKRYRKTRNNIKEVDIHENEIVGVCAYSPFNRIGELDAESRNGVLRRALGLAS